MNQLSRRNFPTFENENEDADDKIDYPLSYPSRPRYRLSRPIIDYQDLYLEDELPRSLPSEEYILLPVRRDRILRDDKVTRNLRKKRRILELQL